MTVKELIEIAQKASPDAEVVVEHRVSHGGDSSYWNAKEFETEVVRVLDNETRLVISIIDGDNK